MTALLDPLQRFVNLYHQDEKLSKDYSNWHCSICLVASDSKETIHLQIEGGLVTQIGSQPESIDLTVTAEEEVLTDILELHRDPNEPYIFGELTVQGEEEHFMRLDYIVSTLCPV